MKRSLASACTDALARVGTWPCHTHSQAGARARTTSAIWSHTAALPPQHAAACPPLPTACGLPPGLPPRPLVRARAAGAHRFVHVRVQLQRALLERALDLHQVRIARDPQDVVRRARRRRRARLPPPLARPPPRGALSRGRRPEAAPGRLPVVRGAGWHAPGQRGHGGGSPRPARSSRCAPRTPCRRPVMLAYQWCAPAHKQGLSMRAWPYMRHACWPRNGACPTCSACATRTPPGSCCTARAARGARPGPLAAHAPCRQLSPVRAP